MKFLRTRGLPPLLLSSFGAAVALVLPAWALADEPAGDGMSPAASGSSSWALGVAIGISQRPYRDADNKTLALPLLMYENRWVRFGGTGLDLKLPSAGPVSFALRARYSFDGYDADDAPILNGMEDRKSSFWLGGAARWHNPVVDVSAEWVGDASSHSKGQQFKLVLERGFRAGAFEFTPRLGASWLDRKYVDYYYGVTAAEVRADRPFYEGKSTVNAEVGLRTVYGLAPRHALTLDLSTTRLGSAIQDSPLVGRRNVSSARFGYVYRF
ncbi:MAG TPA: MipA/OmpV family protein [Burkholderiaceae bacterium]